MSQGLVWMSGVSPVWGLNVARDDFLTKLRTRGNGPAAVVDNRRNAVVGSPDNGFARFDRPVLSHLQMLQWTYGFPRTSCRY